MATQSATRFRPIPEWTPHTFTQLVFPGRGGDWECCWEEVVESFRELAYKIAQFEPVLICYWDKEVIEGLKHPNFRFVKIRNNDTWVRDFGGIPVEDSAGRRGILKFRFDGWGLKFPANLDNRSTFTLFKAHIFKSFQFTLEGGAIETEGRNILTTASVLTEFNRYHPATVTEQVERLKSIFQIEEVFVLHSGQLEGDDTDGHIDTLARFINPSTIVYTSAPPDDPHFISLSQMEEELKQLPYQLVPLPLPSPLYFAGERLPATYANFYFVNGGVIVPIYGVAEDLEALSIFRRLLPDRKVVPIDASIFVRQHGSVHCLTRDYYHPF